MGAYLIGRMKEASTWRGIVALLMAAGVKLDPTQVDAIIAAGLAVIGVIGVFFGDKITKPKAE